MALAILELLAFEQSNATFRIDTGTNGFYQLKVGRAVERRHGIDWADEIAVSTPVEANTASGDFISSSKNVSISLTGFDEGRAYVQLFTFKTAGGKSPAFSSVVTVPMSFTIPTGAPPELEPMLSLGAAMTRPASAAFRKARVVPCRTPADLYARQTSLEDLLKGIVNVAGPSVLALLTGAKGGGAPLTPLGTPTAPGAQATPAANQGDAIAQLLKTILAAIGAAGTPAVGAMQSLPEPSMRENRFNARSGSHLSHPFIFGIDDALIGMLVGPIVQVLPQLMNAANQRRIQMRQTDNKLMTDILSDVNRRMMLDKLRQATNQAPAAGAPSNGAPADQADLNALIQLLQQLPAAAPGATTSGPQAPVVATPQSVSDTTATASRKAVLSFDAADPLTWNGSQRVLYSRAVPLQLNVRFTVAAAPTTPLPKAIVKIVFKEGDVVRFEKTFKHRDVSANTVLTCALTQEEVVRLPANVNLAVLAQIRWLAPGSGREYAALGATEIVVVDKLFLREQGSAATPTRELTDMKQFRPFWNKLWESPLLDGAGGDGTADKKYLWQLDANAKYSALVLVDQEANGLMETRLAQVPADAESLTAKTEGRMKGGIELSLGELNKLLPLWDGEVVLDAEHLAALRTTAFAKANAGELVYNLKLKGKAAERGMVWVVPMFRLFELTLSGIQQTDDAGQVVAVSEEKVRFPLPVSMRIIGLRSTDEEPDPDAADPAAADTGAEGGAGAEGYAFDGFTIVFADTVMLTQAGK